MLCARFRGLRRTRRDFYFQGAPLPRCTCAKANKRVDSWHQLSHCAVKGDVWARPPGPRRPGTATQGTGPSGGSQRVESRRQGGEHATFSLTKRRGRCVPHHHAMGSAIPRRRGGPAEKGSIPQTRPRSASVVIVASGHRPPPSSEPAPWEAPWPAPCGEQSVERGRGSRPVAPPRSRHEPCPSGTFC